MPASCSRPAPCMAARTACALPKAPQRPHTSRADRQMTSVGATPSLRMRSSTAKAASSWLLRKAPRAADTAAARRWARERRWRAGVAPALPVPTLPPALLRPGIMLLRLWGFCSGGAAPAPPAACGGTAVPTGETRVGPPPAGPCPLSEAGDSIVFDAAAPAAALIPPWACAAAALPMPEPGSGAVAGTGGMTIPDPGAGSPVARRRRVEARRRGPVGLIVRAPLLALPPKPPMPPLRTLPLAPSPAPWLSTEAADMAMDSTLPAALMPLALLPPWPNPMPLPRLACLRRLDDDRPRPRLACRASSASPSATP